MKTITKIILGFILTFATLSSGMAQIKSGPPDSIYLRPTYTCTATNFQFTANTMEFDVYMLHTNYDSTVYLYASAQYYFKINPATANGGHYTFSLVSTDLPVGLRPLNPGAVGDTMLRTAPNNIGNSYEISHTAPGTKIARFRVVTSAASFSGDPFNLVWRSATPLPYTKISAFTGLNNSVVVEIQKPASNIMDFPTGINNPGQVTSAIPTEFALDQNYPNPFNPTTKIDYALPTDGKVNIVVYDITGRELMNLVNSVQTAGYHSVNFNGANLASGMYFYKITVTGENAKNNFSSTKRMVLIK